LNALASLLIPLNQNIAILTKCCCFDLLFSQNVDVWTIRAHTYTQSKCCCLAVLTRSQSQSLHGGTVIGRNYGRCWMPSALLVHRLKRFVDGERKITFLFVLASCWRCTTRRGCAQIIVYAHTDKHTHTHTQTHRHTHTTHPPHAQTHIHT